MGQHIPSREKIKPEVLEKATRQAFSEWSFRTNFLGETHGWRLGTPYLEKMQWMDAVYLASTLLVENRDGSSWTEDQLAAEAYLTFHNERVNQVCDAISSPSWINLGFLNRAAWRQGVVVGAEYIIAQFY